MLCSAWPDGANLPHGGRPSIPVTKELSQAHIFLLTLPSMLGPSACSNPNPINGHIGGSISQALGCQMWYGITLAGWRKGARQDCCFKAFGSPHQLNHSNQDSDWCEVMRGKEMREVDPACPLFFFSEACLIGTVTFDWLIDCCSYSLFWRGDHFWIMFVIHVLFILSPSLLLSGGVSKLHSPKKKITSQSISVVCSVSCFLCFLLIEFESL